MNRRSWLAVCTWPGVAAAPAAQAPALDIELSMGSAREVAARDQILALVARFDIERWLFTRRVRIDERARIPHSHPVLTLNAHYLDDDLAQLATLLHEQFHWFVGRHAQATDAAMADFRRLFPNPPSGRAGARNEYSTFLHLIVCDLEFAALHQLVGDREARRVLGAWSHYTWIYGHVLNDSRIRTVNRRHGLVPP